MGNRVVTGDDRQTLEARYLVGETLVGTKGRYRELLPVRGGVSLEWMM